MMMTILMPGKQKSSKLVFFRIEFCMNCFLLNSHWPSRLQTAYDWPDRSHVTWCAKFDFLRERPPSLARHEQLFHCYSTPRRFFVASKITMTLLLQSWKEPAMHVACWHHLARRNFAQSKQGHATSRCRDWKRALAINKKLGRWQKIRQNHTR